MSLLLLVLACAERKNEGTCADICRELTVSCAYEAYPSFESCEQGCLFEADKGENMDAQLNCLESAQCDTFAIIDCENTTW